MYARSKPRAAWWCIFIAPLCCISPFLPSLLLLSPPPFPCFQVHCGLPSLGLSQVPHRRPQVRKMEERGEEESGGEKWGGAEMGGQGGEVRRGTGLCARSIRDKQVRTPPTWWYKLPECLFCSESEPLINSTRMCYCTHPACCQHVTCSSLTVVSVILPLCSFHLPSSSLVSPPLTSFALACQRCHRVCSQRPGRESIRHRAQLHAGHLAPCTG